MHQRESWDNVIKCAFRIILAVVVVICFAIYGR
jgi:hypothetical protein